MDISSPCAKIDLGDVNIYLHVHNFYKLTWLRWKKFFLMEVKYSVVLLKYGQFSPQTLQQIPHSSHMRVRYGVSFVGLKSDLCSAAVIAFL